MKKLTDRQQEVYDFCKSYVAKYQLTPTLEAIGRRFGCTPQGAHSMLVSLENKDALERKTTWVFKRG